MSPQLKSREKPFGIPMPATIAVIVLVVVIIVAVGYRLYSGYKAPASPQETILFLPETKVASEKPTPTVMPGNQRYQLITRDNPRFTEVSIEPLDATRGTRQTITAKVENPSPVKSVSVAVITDNGEKAVSLRLTEGTEYNGLWSESHVISDSYEKVYRFRFTAEDNYGSSTVTITSR